MRGIRSPRTAASARSSAAKKSSAVTPSGVTTTALSSARSNCKSAAISRLSGDANSFANARFGRRLRPYNPRLSAFFSSRSFAFTFVSFSGPIRTSIFCPAERSCSVGSAYSYITFGWTSAIGPRMSGVASR
jgi:hypothetical protein